MTTNAARIARGYDDNTSPRIGDWIQTFTGRQFWPMDPRPQDMDIRDIAHALSMLCRYNGHCLHFYSVAEHSVLLSHAVSSANAAWALLHDASEAYLADVPRPVKPFLPGYKAAESRVHLTVAEKFGLPDAIPAEVHDADRRILADEAKINMAASSAPWSAMPEPLGIRLNFWEPWRAEKEFLARFVELGGVM